MKLFRTADHSYVPANHENPLSPGVWKKIVACKEDFQAGHVQMINWAKLPAGNRFSSHYHEDMQEIFIVVRGRVEMRVADAIVQLGCGDAVLVEPREVHMMFNAGPDEVEYVVVGVSAGANGRTIVVE